MPHNIALLSSILWLDTLLRNDTRFIQLDFLLVMVIDRFSHRYFLDAIKRFNHGRFSLRLITLQNRLFDCLST